MRRIISIMWLIRCSPTQDLFLNSNVFELEHVHVQTILLSCENTTVSIKKRLKRVALWLLKHYSRLTVLSHLESKSTVLVS